MRTITTEFYNSIYSLLLPFAFTYGLENFEDAIQDAFVSFYQLPIVTNIKGWFYTVVERKLIKNAAANDKQKNMLQQQMGKGSSYDPSSEQEEEKMGNAILVCLWEKYVNELPSRQKEVIIMRYYENKSTAEIAIKMGISDNSVRVLKHNAVQYLRAKLLELEAIRGRVNGNEAGPE